VCLFVADVLSAPVNLELRRLSSTRLEVSWDPPTVHNTELIAGYRVYYHVSSSHLALPSDDDLTHTRWDIKDVTGGPLRVAELADLQPGTSYTVRVRARGVDGRLGNFSEALVTEHTDRSTEGSFCSLADFV